MAESPAERTARLLAEGLELFGQDRVEQAIACWREVLALDPQHREARDYLESAGASAAPREERASVSRALSLVEQGDGPAALTLLRAALARSPQDLEAQAAFDLVRAHLFAAYRARAGSGSGRPRLKVGADQLLRFDLPPEAGFLLSMLDGRTRIEELMTVGGLDAFEVLHLLARLEKAGIVEVAR
jgi:tetratricopeptide (TPR) repeat protein